MSETFQETWHRLKELDGESHSCTDIMFCTCRNSKDAKLDGQVQTACETALDRDSGQIGGSRGFGFTDESKCSK